MKNHRREEFDVLRTLIIISAIVLHYNSRLGLGFLAFPSLFVQKQIFNVGSFFFFTAGYMANQIYLVRFKNDAVKTTIKLGKKALEIFLVYIIYVNFMRLSTGKLIPTDWYNFIYDHKFYTKVLVTFAILYLISPLIIALYSRGKLLFLCLTALLFAIYSVFLYLPVPNTIVNSEIFGIFFGIGDRQIYYPIIPAVFIYCVGFLSSFFDQKLITNAYLFRILFWLPLSILVSHSLLTFSSPLYKETMALLPIKLLATSIFIFLTIILIRRLLLSKKISSIVTKKKFLLIGAKTLTFYITSNLILGFISLQESILTDRIVVFLLLFCLTYLVTAWNFYSDIYGKLQNRKV